MTHFSRTWDTAYEATPANTDDISNDAQRMREMKIDLRQRLEIDHSWAGDEDDGFHKTATMMKRTADPAADADKLILFTKTNSDKLYGKEPSGETVQITPPVASGLLWFTNTEPNGYVFCDGRTIGNSTSGADHQGERFRELFNDIKSWWGNAGTEDFDSSDTVKLPDLRDRTPVGQNDMGHGAVNRVTNYSTNLSDAGGTSTHTLSTSEMPSHNHTGSTGSSSVPAGFSSNSGSSTNGRIKETDNTLSGTRTIASSGHSHNFTTNSTGGGGAHNNMQPFLVVNYIIKY